MVSDLAPFPRAKPLTICIADVEQADVEWLWFPRLPRAKLAILESDPGSGKTLLGIDLAARLSRGMPMPDGANGCRGVTLLISYEDDAGDTIKPRLIAAGADERYVYVPDLRDDDGNPRPLTMPDDLPWLEGMIEETGAALVVIDPLFSGLGGSVDSHKDQSVRTVLTPLTAIAARTGATILGIRHLNKADGMSPLYRGGGSIGVLAAARAGLMIGLDRTDPERQRRFLAQSKSNLGPPAPALGWTIETRDGQPVIAWGEPIDDFNLSDQLAPVNHRTRERGSAEDEAGEFLRDVLAEGPQKATDVYAWADEQGIKKRTLERAKAALAVESIRAEFGGVSYWRLA